MSAVITRRCQVKPSLLGKCGGDSIAKCQYCGRPFCDRHGVRLKDGQEICARKECIAKRADLERHFAYKAAVGSRNDSRACGISDCGRELEAQCVRCNGLFCASHVHRREETVLENQIKVPRMATLCRHCSERRHIWVRQ